MSLTWTVEQNGVAEAFDKLNTALNPVAIAGFLGVTVAPYLDRRIKQRFADQGDDVSGPWAPLRPATQEIRTSMGYGADGPINRRTDALMNSLIGSASIQAEPYGASLTMPGSSPTGELEDKLRTAQMGSTNPSTVPRPVLGMNEADLAFVLGSLGFYFNNPGVRNSR